jgi:MFS family permease
MLHNRNSIWSAILGNAYEWYDFALYGYFSPIIAHLFFPSGNRTTSLILTFAVFATGFLFRPFGAIIFGHIGDRFGRKRALMFSTLLMALPTTLMGVLPTYQQIGLLAPIMLVILRLLQGMAVSGELSGAAAYLIEHARYDKRGLAGSLVMSSVYAGQLLGSLVGLIVSWSFAPEILHAWGWRIPFLFSLLLGLFIFILRIYSPETPKFKTNRRVEKVCVAPIKITFQKYRRNVITIIGFICVAAVSGYILIGFLPAYFVEHMHFSLHEALLLNTVGMTVVMTVTPLIGFWSDRVGRKTFLVAGTLGFIVSAYPMFWLFAQQSLPLAMIGEIFYAINLACLNGSTTATMAEMFPTNVRQSGTGIAFNISLAIFGGTAPLVAEYAVDLFNTYYAAAGYLVACAIFSLLFIGSLKDRYQATLY